MAYSINISVQGSEWWNHRLHQLSGPVLHVVCQEAVNEMADEMATMAAGNAPRDSGALAASVRSKHGRRLDKNPAAYMTSSSRGQRPRERKGTPRNAGSARRARLSQLIRLTSGQIGRRNGRSNWHAVPVEFGHRVGRKKTNANIGQARRKRRTTTQKALIRRLNWSRTFVPPRPFAELAKEAVAPQARWRVMQAIERALTYLGA